MDSTLIIFNPSYGLKHDIKRTYLFSRENADNVPDFNDQWLSVIHPIYAMFLALLSTPKTYKTAVNDISQFLSIDVQSATNLLDKFLSQKDAFHSNFDGVTSQFPKNLLINYDQKIKYTEYLPEEFQYTELDFTTQRSLNTPRTVVFMPTGRCSVKCEYCYADRRSHTFMPFEQVKRFIEECRAYRVFSIFLTGGDILLYPYWKELFKVLRTNNFGTSFISTKTPGDCDDILFIKAHKLFLQFSLDSATPQTLTKLIKSKPNYLQRIAEFFKALSDNDIEFRIATVLTTINSSLEEIENLFNFICKFPTVKSWTIRCAMRSLYSSTTFESLKLSPSQIDDIDNLLKKLKAKCSFDISYELRPEDKYFKGENGSPSFQSSRCSANYSNVMVLPDGKVTICEQLYWNPNYIIGDISQQNLHDIWNSNKALSLAVRCEEDLQINNPCKDCKLLDKCNSYPNRCIVDVIKAYGEENSDYPDPRCIKAPKPKYPF